MLSRRPVFLSVRCLLSWLCAMGAGWLHGRLSAEGIGSVFVIDFENRNWTQPSADQSAPAQILGNEAAPFINRLVRPGDPQARFVSFASAYHQALATPSGENPSIHPSEPNYIWQEAGSNLGVRDDNDPYGAGDQAATIETYWESHREVPHQHLTGLLQSAGSSWMAYEEDTNLLNSAGGNANRGGLATSQPAPRAQWTVPLASFAGTSSLYTNEYNRSHQYNFAAKHCGPLFFSDTSGAGDPTSKNPSVSHYAPLQQLFEDLRNDRVARYNLITPNEYNDMHTPLINGFTYHQSHYTGDLAMLAQGDNFLSTVIPKIEASAAFQRNGVIIIWTDETEGYPANDFAHCLMEIIISPLAKGNAYEVKKDLTHSSDVATLQKIFRLRAATPSGFLNDAANPSNGSRTLDFSDFFKPGVIPDALTSR